MWLLFGFSAIITAILNVAWWAMHRNAAFFRFASLSLTALTVCAFYSQDAAWVAKQDWSALMDVVPGTSALLWILTCASIALNGISLFRKNGK